MAGVTIPSVNLEVRDNEFLVLAGNGAVALLRIVAGLEKGEVRIGDRDAGNLPPKERDVAMVFSKGALYPRLTVRENIAAPLKARKYAKPEIEKRVKEAASILRIEPLLEKKPSALPDIECERAGLARAMALRPKVYLIHPLEMHAELSVLRQRIQATIIYATDDPAEAMALGDRIAVLKDGAIQQVDAPAAIHDYPANLFVAGFSSMNFIGGKLKELPDGFSFKESGGGNIECKLGNRPTAKPYAGKDVILGIHPKEIAVAGEKAGGCVFQAVVDSVEPLGSETIFRVQTGGHTVVCRARASADHGDEGRRMRFEMNPAKAHLFDPATTSRIA